MLQKYKIYNVHQAIFETNDEIIFGKKIEELKSTHLFIQAAGGIVHNEFEEILFIERLGKIDLPKGKMEKGESPSECALREVEEECGIGNLILGNLQSKTYHTYTMEDQKVLKETFWFNILTKKPEILLPQIEEGITRVYWANKEKHKTQILNNSYLLIKDLLFS